MTTAQRVVAGDVQPAADASATTVASARRGSVLDAARGPQGQGQADAQPRSRGRGGAAAVEVDVETCGAEDGAKAAAAARAAAGESETEDLPNECAALRTRLRFAATTVRVEEAGVAGAAGARGGAEGAGALSTVDERHGIPVPK